MMIKKSIHSSQALHLFKDDDQAIELFKDDDQAIDRFILPFVSSLIE